MVQIRATANHTSHLSKSYFAYCNIANVHKPAWLNTGHTYLNPTSLTATTANAIAEAIGMKSHLSKSYFAYCNITERIEF